jgi:hypothetical protein
MPDPLAQQLRPTWVTEAVGSVREAARIRWGFTNESWRVTTLEILSQPSLGAAARERWRDQLRACARWTSARG